MALQVSYARVARTFWTDPDIKRRLTPEQKELLLYYFTSPHGNMIGLYYLPLEYASSETGLDLADVRSWTAGELADFVSYDEETEEVLVHRAAVHQIGPELKAGDNRAKAIDRILVDAHSPRLVQRFHDLYAHWPITNPLPCGKEPTEGPSEAPSEAPPKPDAVADAVSVTGTESSSSIVPPADQGDHGELASKAIRLANRGMGDNARIGDSLTPIPTSHGSRTVVLEWLQEGIPWDVIESAVYSVTQKYEPDARHRQISTMKYFDGPVREEWDRTQAQQTEAPNAGSERRNGRSHGRGSRSKGRGQAGQGGRGESSHRTGFVYEE